MSAVPVLSATDYQNNILMELSKIGDATFETQVKTYWEIHAGIRPVRLRYLYTKRSAITALLGNLVTEVQWSVGPIEVNDGQEATNLKALFALVDEELKVLEARLAGNRGGATGTMTTTAPITTSTPIPVLSAPDPNDRRYRGDPLIRSWTRKL